MTGLLEGGSGVGDGNNDDEGIMVDKKGRGANKAQMYQ